MIPALRLSLRIFAACAIFSFLPARATAQAGNPLKSVRNYMCQLEDLDKPGTVDRLAQSGYDMLIVEPAFNLKSSENFDAKAMVKSLHAGKPGRIVLAYLAIGAAESFRTYWGTDWHAADGKISARPGFLLGPDPDGDADTFLVRYWRSRWQSIFVGKNALLDKIMADGFDGVYLDWIEAYDEDAVDDAADRDKIVPAAAMVNFISAIRDQVRKSKPDAVVVAQDAAYLLDDAPRYSQVIDGIVFEGTWYGGRDSAKWNDADAGDVANTEVDEDSTSNLIRQYHKYLRAGLPVFTMDYCVNRTRAAVVYRKSAGEGFVPLVTRVSLENITPTPPPNLLASNPPATQP
jgi:cysteinyl-tRNA synthetase